MKNLQDLYDAYLETRPSTGKVKTASSLLIHVCKALDISSQEEVTSEYFDTIPRALDSFFLAHPTKATMDKTMLAEMVGRVGPKKRVKKLLEKLLTDQDENVRQFSLHSLEYYGTQHPGVILPYINRFRKSSDESMVTTAAMLVGNLQCSEQYMVVLDRIKNWYTSGDTTFVSEALKRMVILRKQKKCDNKFMSIEELKDWCHKNCKKVTSEVFGE